MEQIEPDFELAKQLHEQYAINTNERTNSFVSFVVALLALFGFFGYVFAYTSPNFAISGYLVESNHKVMSIEVFFLCSVLTSFILCFLALISLQLGYASRRDQIIINNIRQVFIEKEDERKQIFGNLYNPADKTWCNFIPDYFNFFYGLFVLGEFAVIIITFIKSTLSVRYSDCCFLMKWTIITMLIQMVFVFISLCVRCCYYNKYKQNISNNK
jgi:hypothetical protein